jgi:hypothetical protein
MDSQRAPWFIFPIPNDKGESKSADDFNAHLLKSASKGWIAMKPVLIIVDMLKDTFNKHPDAFITKKTLKKM